METSNAETQTSHLSCVFQVKRLPPGSSALPERSVTLLIPPPGMLQPEVHPDAPQPPSGSQLRPYPQHQPHAGPSSAAGEPTVVPSHRGSPLHLSADSALSSSSLPGRGSTLNPPPTLPQWGENVTLMSQAPGGGENGSSQLHHLSADVRALQGRVGSRRRATLDKLMLRDNQTKDVFSVRLYAEKTTRYTVTFKSAQANI